MTAKKTEEEAPKTQADLTPKERAAALTMGQKPKKKDDDNG